MDWLYGISITCFAASYLLVFALEASRVFFKAPLRKVLIIGLGVAGLFAHTVYLALQQQLELGHQGLWLGSWSGWVFAAAWLIVVSYLWLTIRKPQSPIGMFLLPVVLILIAFGSVLQTYTGFNSGQAKSVWQMVHGISLLMGTVVVAIGFVFGVMYLVKAKRLKQKKLGLGPVRLPSLEWLQKSSERSLVISVTFLAIGLASGLLINILNQRLNSETGDLAANVLPWNDPVVWSSGILFTWLATALVFSITYQPARQGRKVAYLVMTSFLFLMLELGIVWWAGHGVSTVAVVAKEVLL